MSMTDDSYQTVAQRGEATIRERSSKFYAYACHVESEEDVRAILDPLRKEFYDATHHCYAWRIGAKGEQFRANDDGEPSGTAGKPILGQLLSHSLTNTLVVVVRYFGGTKLGVPGLIAAYREAAEAAINAATIEERTVDISFRVEFAYETMNAVMKVVKDVEPRVIGQEFDNICSMTLSIRASLADMLRSRLEKVEGARVEQL